MSGFPVPNALYVEHIPQLKSVTTDEIEITADGHAMPPQTPGVGMAWDRQAIESPRVA